MAAAAPAAYRILDAASLRPYLAALAAIRTRLGGEPGQWQVREVGDGNLNLVFIVEGPAGAVCVKQALPYVRAAGPSWPMTPERAWFENAYFRAVAPHVGRLIPEIFHYDAELYCTVMERLSPHVILRHGLIAGRHYPTLARDVGEYIARASFFTSDIAFPFERKLDGMALFAANKPLIRISVDLIFTDPYRDSSRNRHTSPQLNAAVAELRADTAARLAAMRFGYKFLNQPEALIHGDLHSGSVMVTPTDTRVIDPEFAFYGPIGFDLGAFLGNLLLSWYSQAGHATPADDREHYRRWILEQAGVFWSTFHQRFLALWAEHAGGDAFPPVLFGSVGRDTIEAARERYMHTVFADMIGFAACKMIRRIVGFAHVIDLESIDDPRRRAACEAGALAMARKMLAHPAQFESMPSVAEAVRHV
ncbi:MAG: S-methyl-5-thioribose kinase [Steroidobacteraceae bacterium]